MRKTSIRHHAANSKEWLDDIPSILRERALLCAVERRVPMDLALLVGLATIATALGKGLVVQSGRQRETRANLFILLGTASGIGKSEVFRDMMAPLLDFESELHQWWAAEPAVRARAGEELLKAQVLGLRSFVREYPQGGLEIFRRLEEAEGKRAICSRYLDALCLLADDATSEALVEIMGRSGEAIATVSADARYPLKRLATTNSKEESFYLKAYSGDLTLPSRVTRRASRLRSPCLTALYLTQCDAYQAFIAKALRTRSGLLPRFLHAEIVTDHSDEAKIDLRRASPIRSSYEKTLQTLVETYRFENESGVVKPTASAAKHLGAIEDDAREKAATDDSIHGEILRRRAEQTWRVALCLHAAEHGPQSALHSLSREHTQCAVRIVENFTKLE